MKLTKPQLRSLRWAKRKYTDGRVPPYVFRDYRSAPTLIQAGLIELWRGYGAPMYKFTQKGLDALEAASVVPSGTVSELVPATVHGPELDTKKSL